MIRKVCFSLIGAASFGMAFYASYDLASVKISLIVCWLTFAVFMFVFGHPDLVKSIKFLGNTITLRKVEEEINHLRLLAESNTAAILEVVQTQMRFGGVPEDEKVKIYNQLTNVLVSVGLSAEKIKNIQSRWHYWVEGDYVRRILDANCVNHPAISGEEKKSLWRSTRQELFDKGVNNITPDKLIEIFKEFDAYSDEIKELIGDYDYYLKNKRHRDFEKWKSIIK